MFLLQLGVSRGCRVAARVVFEVLDVTGVTEFGVTSIAGVSAVASVARFDETGLEKDTVFVIPTSVYNAKQNNNTARYTR